MPPSMIGYCSRGSGKPAAANDPQRSDLEARCRAGHSQGPAPPGSTFTSRIERPGAAPTVPPCVADPRVEDASSQRIVDASPNCRSVRRPETSINVRATVVVGIDSIDREVRLEQRAGPMPDHALEPLVATERRDHLDAHVLDTCFRARSRPAVPCDAATPSPPASTAASTACSHVGGAARQRVDVAVERAATVPLVSSPSICRAAQPALECLVASDQAVLPPHERCTPTPCPPSGDHRNRVRHSPFAHSNRVSTRLE